MGKSPVEERRRPSSPACSWDGDEQLLRRETHHEGDGSPTFREGQCVSEAGRARSSSYVVQSAQERRRYVVNEDPFDGTTDVKIECVDVEETIPRPRDSISTSGKASTPTEFAASPAEKRIKEEAQDEEDPIETQEADGVPW